MANKKTLVLVTLLVLVVALAAPAHSLCGMNNGDFMSCQPAATATTGPTVHPSEQCCATLRQGDLKCLCSYKNSPWLSMYNIDPKRAMELLGKCGLTTPANC